MKQYEVSVSFVVEAKDKEIAAQLGETVADMILDHNIVPSVRIGTKEAK